jgi:hypothetical protein
VLYNSFWDKSARRVFKKQHFIAEILSRAFPQKNAKKAVNEQKHTHRNRQY